LSLSIAKNCATMPRSSASTRICFCCFRAIGPGRAREGQRHFARRRVGAAGGEPADATVEKKECACTFRSRERGHVPSPRVAEEGASARARTHHVGELELGRGGDRGLRREARERGGAGGGVSASGGASYDEREDEGGNVRRAALARRDAGRRRVTEVSTPPVWAWRRAREDARDRSEPWGRCPAVCGGVCGACAFLTRIENETRV
jgi:hypothetical protein